MTKQQLMFDQGVCDQINQERECQLQARYLLLAICLLRAVDLALHLQTLGNAAHWFNASMRACMMTSCGLLQTP